MNTDTNLASIKRGSQWEQMAEYIKTTHPQHLAGFAEILAPFGQYLLQDDFLNEAKR